jgi:hypothetical protein
VMAAPDGGTYFYLCATCNSEPMWTLTRQGDVATSWACPEHLSEVAEGLQRDTEITRLIVTLSAKEHEWAEIEKALAKVVGDAAPRTDEETK